MEETRDIPAEELSALRNPATRRGAFDRLVGAYLRPLYWHARRLVVVHEDAEDVVQETFIRAYDKIGTFRGGAVRPGVLAGRRARAGTQEEGKRRVTACFPRWIAYLCGKRISAQAGGARAYCRQSLHLRSACTIFAAKSGLWHEKKQITP